MAAKLSKIYQIPFHRRSHHCTGISMGQSDTRRIKYIFIRKTKRNEALTAA